MRIDLFGLKIDTLTYIQVLKQLETFLSDPDQHYLITANPELALKCWEDESLLATVNRADLITADGIGLVWASKFIKMPPKSLAFSFIQAYVSALMILLKRNDYYDDIPERVVGVDLMEKICQLSSDKGWKIFLLGGRQGIAEKTAQVLKKKFLRLEITGFDSGPSSIEYAAESAKAALIEKINQSRPNIIFIAFGQPKQEFWIRDNLNKLPSVKLAIGVGGSFDFLSGEIKRAPEIYRFLGIEWLWRLINQPSRAFRIFDATFKFIFKITILKHHLKTR